MRVAEFGGDAEAWDRFVDAAPGGTFCHLHAWRDVLAEGLGHELRLLAAEVDGRLEGVLPLARVRGPLGTFLVSIPFLSYGGPIGTPDAVRALVAYAVDRGRREGVDLVELRCRSRNWSPGATPHAGPAHPDSEMGPASEVATSLPEGVRVSDRRVAVVLSLPGDAEALWQGLRSKVRSQVRRPMKEGMEVRFGGDLLDDFYAVFARNMRDLGTPALPLAFFRALVDRFPRFARIGVVYHEGDPAAAGFGFLWRGEIEMTWASSLRRLNRLAPNMLLYWEFMRYASEAGAAAFNFGRCPPGGGTHRFKLQWGGVDLPLPWLQWTDGDIGGTPSPASGGYALATRLWSRLPMPVANLVGPWIARTIP